MLSRSRNLEKRKRLSESRKRETAVLLDRRLKNPVIAGKQVVKKVRLKFIRTLTKQTLKALTEQAQVKIEVVKKLRLKSIRTSTEHAHVKQPVQRPQLTQPGEIENTTLFFNEMGTLGRTEPINQHNTVNSGTNASHQPEIVPHDASILEDLPNPAWTFPKISPIGKTKIQTEVCTEIPECLIKNAKKINKIVFADLDNWPKLFHRFPLPLPKRIFVWGFHGLKPWRPPENVTCYSEVNEAGMFHLQLCGKTKDAADGAILIAVIEMNNHWQFPKEISYVLVSGDAIFICEALQRCMKQSVREIVLVDPHKILGEYLGEARKKLKEYLGEAHKILGEYPGEVRKKLKEYLGEAHKILREYPGEVHKILGEYPGEAHKILGEYPGEAHKILREYLGEARKKLAEYPGEAHKILEEYPGEVHKKLGEYPGEAHKKLREYLGEVHKKLKEYPEEAHEILREYLGEAHKKLKEDPGEAHEILRECQGKADLRIYNEIIGTKDTEGGKVENSVVREAVNRQALISSMKLLYMYLLCQEEIPHTTIIQHLMNVAKHLGVDVLTFQKKGDKAKCSSQQHIDYLVNLFGRQIWEELREEILASPFYSVIVDISTTLELVIYLRYLQNGKSKTVFGEIINISDGKADTIMEAITKFLERIKIPMKNMVAFGSDGAEVMVGTLLKEQVLHLLTNHCVAHQLHLASAQAASSIPYLTKFTRIVEQLLQFYANSGERMSGLQEIQKLLNEPSRKITEAKDMRWLSHDRAVGAIRRCLPSLLTSLDREASERTDVQAQGLLSYMRTYDFVAALHMFCDILPVLSDLSCSFKAEDGAYTMDEDLVTDTIDTIRVLGERPGEHFSSLGKVMDNLVTLPFGFHLPTDTERTKFEENVYRKFIAAVIENLQKRFPDIPLLEAFSAFNVQQWPDTDQDLMAYGGDSIQTLAGHLRPILRNAKNIPMEYSKLKNIVEESAKKAEREKTHGEKEVVNLRKMTTQRIMEEVAGPLSTTLPNLAIIATVGLLIPTATADCERGFSTLSRVKTKLRSRPSNSTLNSLLMILMEGPDVLKFNYNEAVSTWIKEMKRRL